jgi:two-component system phosphate regulon sensor histidine kinase PhoR
MTSYLLVVGLVFVPVFLYLRTKLPEEICGVVERELERELEVLVDRLGDVRPDGLAAAAAPLVAAIPQRVTVIAEDGTVVDDTILHGPDARREPMENHAGRPEVREAIRDGYGTSRRTSATTHETYVYAAMRFPREGPARGVLRLAVRIEDAARGASRFALFLQRTGAVALSAAVILSFIAALVVARPLRRISAAARAFAAGDFGHPIDVTSQDELGDVAQALGELAAQLRSRLAEAGADRAALRALVDELPVGVILFDAQGSPFALNGRARELLRLGAADELERTLDLARVAPHAAARERVLRTGISEELPLEPPWVPESALRARWLAIASAKGDAQAALVVFPEADADAARFFPPPRPHEVEAIEIGTLCSRGLARLEARGVAEPVAVALSDPTVRVVEAAGRSAFAVGHLLAGAAADAGRVVDEVLPNGVRLRVRLRGRRWVPEPAQLAISCLGGSAGVVTESGESEAWLLVPRA